MTDVTTSAPTAPPPALIEEKAGGDLVAVYDTLEVAEREKVDAYFGRIDMSDTMSIISYAAEAQKEATDVASEMIGGVKNKDAGAAGEVINEMMSHIRGLSIDDISTEKPSGGFFGFFRKKIYDLAGFVQQYESIEGQIETTIDKIDKQQDVLQRDIMWLDRMYDATLRFYDELQMAVIAGKRKIQEIEAVTLPGLVQAAEASGDVADAQAVQQLGARRDDLIRRVDTLMQTRLDSMEALAIIRLIQDGDVGLMNQFTDAKVNVIPAWRRQISLAIALKNQSNAAELAKEVYDATNDMKSRTAAALKSGTAAVRTQLERQVFDIETLKQSNAMLIETMHEASRIAAEGRDRRAKAETVYAELEDNLRQALIDSGVG